MNNNNMISNENTHIEQLQRAVQSGLLSEFIFRSFLEFQQQRGQAQWNDSKTNLAFLDKKQG